MTANRDLAHSTLTALRTALGSLRRHPGLAATFLAATLAQGALQGGMVWALREVLVSLSKPGGAARGALDGGALAVFTVCVLRPAGVYAAQRISPRLAHRVAIEWMFRV